MRTLVATAALALTLALTGCSGSSSDGGDYVESSSAPTSTTVEFETLDEMRLAYQELTGTTCEEVEPDTLSVFCDDETEVGDVLILDADDPDAVQSVTTSRLLQKDGPEGAFAAYDSAWGWAVVTSDVDRLALVVDSFAGASQETLSRDDVTS